MAWWHSKKIWSFVGGAATALVGVVAAKQPKTREAAVKLTAFGIKTKDAAQENLQSIKDEAEDIAADAREKAKKDAIIAERRLEIEKRIEKELEAELAVAAEQES